MHGFNSIMLKDENGEPAPVYSVASGLDYPSSGPEHAFLHDIGRVKYDVITDDETIDAFFELSRMEGIIPAIESSHAVAYGIVGLIYIRGSAPVLGSIAYLFVYAAIVGILWLCGLFSFAWWWIAILVVAFIALIAGIMYIKDKIEGPF